MTYIVSSGALNSIHSLTVKQNIGRSLCRCRLHTLFRILSLLNRQKLAYKLELKVTWKHCQLLSRTLYSTVLLTCFLHFSACFDNYMYGELSVKLIVATSFSTKLWLRQYLEHLSPNRLENISLFIDYAW